ncbi:sulfite exporter TauE/SafE family protein [Mucilaginibacter myungsuensis]|uniref:Probable membrane transporter protein n=1 Tax=Mucilaginibacter myungsuensis TaxID=649104 RepID=A0A929PYL3_9SPHI|nr:sulfite exporter TauE/SafE family protein [Mucilaginibacter myungsuensis]MBE9664401.1 sulfite exporter TauE/SafE family protein [Mucilaginibacter myungsuensis]MDN3597112.1 sulfite exporter TauE/SafE family protein [Mucilaginibacter myungsuensis]
MSVIVLTLIILVGSYFAGLLGSLTGLGGGFIIIPLLTLGLNVDIHYAIGASLISVIATSSGAAAAYVKEGITNIRIGMFLEIATTIGAFMGATIALHIQTHYIAILFGMILAFSAVMSFVKKKQEILPEGSPMADKFKLNGSYPTPDGVVKYGVRNVGGGFFMMVFAGTISGLLGIGSGALKVVAMDSIMRIPFKVSTTTSNFMIGVTAAASAVVYLQRGYIDPAISMPVVVGVLLGALSGSKILINARSAGWLRWLFTIIVSILAIQMIYNGLTGRL